MERSKEPSTVQKEGFPMEKMTTKLRRLLKEKDYLVAPCAYDAGLA